MLQWYGLCAIHQSSSWLPELCYMVPGPEALWPFRTLLHIHRLQSLCMCMCVFCNGCHSGRPKIQAGRVCVLSGFLSTRLADQNEPRVSRVCSHWVSVVAVVLPTLVVCTTTLLLWAGEEKKKLVLRWLRAVEPALAFLWPRAWELLSDCSLSMWLRFRCLPASVSSKKRHQCFSQSRGRQLRTHSATATQPAIWSGDQPSVAWEIHT